eukprot:2179450-Amphidinium_carterae.2
MCGAPVQRLVRFSAPSHDHHVLLSQVDADLTCRSTVRPVRLPYSAAQLSEHDLGLTPTEDGPVVLYCGHGLAESGPVLRGDRSVIALPSAPCELARAPFAAWWPWHWPGCIRADMTAARIG